MGCLSRSRPLALANLSRVRGRVGLALCDHRQDGEQQPAERAGGVVHGPAAVETDPAGGEFGGNVAGTGEGAGKPFEFGHHEGVAGSAGGEGFAQAGPGDAVVNVDT